MGVSTTSPSGAVDTTLLARVDTGVKEVPQPSLGGAVTSVTDAGGGEITCNSTAHGRSAGEVIHLADTLYYDGQYTIESVLTDSFNVAVAFDSNSTGGVWLDNNEYIANDQSKGGGDVVYYRNKAGNQIAQTTKLGIKPKNISLLAGKVFDPTTAWMFAGSFKSSSEHSSFTLSTTAGTLQMFCGSSFSTTNDSHDLHIEYTKL